VRGIEFTDQEIDDLYAFLREHDGLQMQLAVTTDRMPYRAVLTRWRSMTPNPALNRTGRAAFSRSVGAARR
jgi:hypothetical protein